MTEVEQFEYSIESAAFNSGDTPRSSDYRKFFIRESEQRLRAAVFLIKQHDNLTWELNNDAFVARAHAALEWVEIFAAKGRSLLDHYHLRPERVTGLQALVETAEHTVNRRR